MTIERKVVVGLDDIQAISIECTACGYRVTLPPDNLKDPPIRCDHCGKEWIIPSPAEYDRNVAQHPACSLIRNLRTMRTLIRNSPMGYRILLEFREPSDED
jgi:DNA-directed RNA polymerase subunit RPC12/RpoP